MDNLLKLHSLEQHLGLDRIAVRRVVDFLDQRAVTSEGPRRFGKA
jgi:hypothetical protein